MLTTNCKWKHLFKEFNLNCSASRHTCEYAVNETSGLHSCPFHAFPSTSRPIFENREFDIAMQFVSSVNSDRSILHPFLVQQMSQMSEYESCSFAVTPLQIRSSQQRDRPHTLQAALKAIAKCKCEAVISIRKYIPVLHDNELTRWKISQSISFTWY